MYYDITGLCPERRMGGFGFAIKLYPEWKRLVAARALTQQHVETALQNMGREWLDICGYDQIFDPDNCGFDADEKAKPGPNARPTYEPNHALRVTWGEWGPEHITVPGNACGLDISDSIGRPSGGRILLPHNVDCWRQVNLLLVTFCWFADDLSLHWQLNGERTEE